MILPFTSVFARVVLLAAALQGINAHGGEEEDEEEACTPCPPRSTVTRTKTVTVGGITPAPDAAFQKGAMRTVVVTRFHTVTRGSTGGGGTPGKGDIFQSGQKAQSDPINDSPSGSSDEAAVEYEYVYTDANGETFVDDASVLYLPTAGPNEIGGSSGGSFAKAEADDDMDMDMDMGMPSVAAGKAATSGTIQTSTSSSDFPKVVAGQEYEDEMSYFHETEHGAECSAPGGVYDSRGACKIINMPDLLDNPLDRVSVPKYLWTQFFPAGGAITPTEPGICGRILTFKSNNKEIKLMAADHMDDNNFDMCLNIWEKFGYKEDKSVKPVKFILESET